MKCNVCKQHVALNQKRNCFDCQKKLDVQLAFAESMPKKPIKRARFLTKDERRRNIEMGLIKPKANLDRKQLSAGEKDD